MENNVAANADVVEEANVAEAALPQKKQRKPINQQKLQDNLWGWIFCIPLIVGTVWFVYICLVAALLLSFTDYSVYNTSGLSMFEYLAEMGLHPAKNPDTGAVDALGWYKYAFTHTVDAGGGYMMNELGIHLFNTVFYMIGIPIGMILAMFFAVCMTRDIPGANVFRVLYYFPSVASTVSIVYTFKLMFSNAGVMNQLLGLTDFRGQGFTWLSIGTGLESLTWNGLTGQSVMNAFMNSSYWCQGLITKCIIIIMSVWKGLGGTVILYIAGLSGVNSATKEAAQIDGANGWQIFWKVTMPDLYPTIFYNIVTAVIGGMQIYMEPELMAANAAFTSGYVWLIYNYGITARNPAQSHGAAYGMILAVMILVLTLFQFWLDSKNKD